MPPAHCNHWSTKFRGNTTISRTTPLLFSSFHENTITVNPHPISIPDHIYRYFCILYLHSVNDIDKLSSWIRQSTQTQSAWVTGITAVAMLHIVSILISSPIRSTTLRKLCSGFRRWSLTTDIRSSW
ncbi:hypothetical protein L873DRAFT_389812 [Choiromyces venosus 120613-1]|uniref:Uncharacterized protein n=1 Tax=Choiromyces venosus 120613-1 TaxID=1336337 RepID=A0A3N4J121_9PEZI|nr:hypothetical protein L873DRAFT_389812 [Choiromyces venosus 120613-1]